MWWESPAGVTCNGMWIDAVTGFLTKFPSIPELFEGCTILFEWLVSCVLTCVELGSVMWVETKKKDIPNHVAWAQRVLWLAATYRDEMVTTLPFIQVMCVLKILDEFLADDYTSYTNFAQAVGNVKLEKLWSLCNTTDTIDSLKIVKR